ncbi:MAG: T9SS type A sorting domain-containing protein [Chitinophagaceae bacterium]|jgi:hypothetical protein
MKKYSLFLKLILLCTLLGNSAQAQISSAMEFLDINQIKAGHMVHGDMWNNPATSQPSMEYPKGSEKHASYAAAIWMSGVDNTGLLHVSAQLYRGVGVDYFPGPLDASGATTSTTITNWGKIWKVNYADIKTFLALTSKTTTTIPKVILEWPAKGNIYAKGNAGVALTISSDMAPFIDTDGDGIYDATKGDYPKMKGDQMLWWVFNDNGTQHTGSKGLPLKVEYHAMAYAYARGTAADRMLFYEFKMFNKSTEKYNGFRYALFSDADLGNSSDDYIAFDSTHRMAIEYNAVIPDGPNGKNSYGSHPPLTGLSFIEMPGDNYPAAMLPAGSFNYFERGFSGPLADPIVDTQFNNVMHTKGSLGNAMPFEGLYAYPITKGAVMCDSSFPYRDQRYVITSNDYAFQPGTTAKIAMAFLVTDTNGNACGAINFKELTDLADTAWKIYYNPLPLKTTELLIAKNKLSLYPNPAQTILYISTGKNTTANESLRVIDALGKIIQVPIVKNADKFEVNINNLAAGVYSVLYYDGEQTSATSFVKN